jgi:hypothetical protein
MTHTRKTSALNPELTNESVDRIYHDWDEALSRLMDFVESMELNDQGLIQHHAVYWGWRGVNVMLTDTYRR